MNKQIQKYLLIAVDCKHTMFFVVCVFAQYLYVEARFHSKLIQAVNILINICNIRGIKLDVQMKFNKAAVVMVPCSVPRKSTSSPTYNS